MNICIPKESRPYEYRVGLPPAGAELFVKYGHTVYLESNAGEGAGFTDEDYIKSGAMVVYSREEIFGRADLTLKFTRPLYDELELMRQGQAIAGFLHLATARQDKIDMLIDKKITTIAYEQVEESDGYRPILAPLSQIGGRMVVQVAARLLQNDHGGKGILLGGAAGVPSAEVVILGAGIVGETAVETFAGVGAQITLMDVDLRRLQQIQSRSIYPFVTMLSTPYNLRRASAYADVLIGAIAVPGERSPIIISRDMVANMKPQSILIDMSIDQGGCFETSRPTDHGSSTYIEESIIHYCVPNMSGVLGRTATYALFYGAYPYLETIARDGLETAVQSNSGLENGVLTLKGKPLRLKRAGDVKGGR